MIGGGKMERQSFSPCCSSSTSSASGQRRRSDFLNIFKVFSIITRQNTLVLDMPLAVICLLFLSFK